ncbi:hypothetical protein F5884DRAFT_796559 [Xylogone sp. PMI_703]|nr:hypothetical protein F5884DRAFT_796559 [Xylogone sp. PMI_703]
MYETQPSVGSQLDLEAVLSGFGAYSDSHSPSLGRYSEPSLVPDNVTTTNLHNLGLSNYFSMNDCLQLQQITPEMDDMHATVSTQGSTDEPSFSHSSHGEDLNTQTLPDDTSNTMTVDREVPEISVSIRGPEARQRTRKRQHNQRKPLTPEERVRINAMRKQGSCWSCHINKKPCDPNTPCRNCKNNATAPIFNQPCCRDNVMDVMPFRRGNSRMGKTDSKLPKLSWPDENTEVKWVKLVYPFQIDHGRTRPVLKVACRQFNPDPDEVLDEEYNVNGRSIRLRLPPYACFDQYDTRMKTMMSDFMDDCMKSMEMTMLSMITDELHRCTIAEAIRYSRGPNGKYVNEALKIRAGAVLIASSLSLHGEENLGILDYPAETPSYFKKPIPTVLEYQMDTMSIDVMKFHLRVALRRLKELIFKQKPKEVWYETFLIIFVLLSTLEFVYQKQEVYVAWHQGTSQYSSVNHVASEMMKEWRQSAVNLIRHFRFVLRGHTPFTKSWQQNKTNGLDVEASRFLARVNNIVHIRKPELEGLKESKEFVPFMWLSHLFVD